MRYRNDQQKNTVISVYLQGGGLPSVADSLRAGEAIQSIPVDPSSVALLELLAASTPAQIDAWIAKHRPSRAGNPQLLALMTARPEEWAGVVVRALETAGSASGAARALGVSERTMRRWLHHPEIAKRAPRWTPKVRHAG